MEGLITRATRWWQTPKPLYQKLLLGLGVAMLLIGAVFMVVEIPHRQAAPLKAKIQRERQDLLPNDRLKLEHDARKLENDARTALIQGLGGAALLIGLFFTWRSIRVTERNLQLTQAAAADNLRVAMDGNVTERFMRAIEHLGHNELVVRLGGIYTLEQIAWPPMRDQSPVSLAIMGNRWPIMEMLTLQRRLYVDMIIQGMYSASGPPANGEEAEDVTSVSDRRGGVRHSPVCA